MTQVLMDLVKIILYIINILKYEATYSIIATISFRETVDPSFTLISFIVPSLLDFIAICIFIDSRTTIGSPSFILSPFETEILTTLPGIWLVTLLARLTVPLAFNDFSIISVILDCFFISIITPSIKSLYFVSVEERILT